MNYDIGKKTKGWIIEAHIKNITVKKKHSLQRILYHNKKNKAQYGIHFI
jgi:hypothetical protein